MGERRDLEAVLETALDAAIALTRGWTRLYTFGLDAAARQARIVQIESDLWESIDDARRSGVVASATAFQIVLRLVLGIADDLAWRGEEASPEMVSWRIRLAAMGMLGAVMIGGAVMIIAGGPLTLPQVGSPKQAILKPPPPPPPPPPPGYRRISTGP